MKEEKMVKDYQKPSSCYSQKYDQAPLKYMERHDSRESKSASKLKKESYKGRYQ